MKPRLGGHVLADALVAQGIDHVFEVPGESFLDTLDGLHDTGEKLKLVTCRFKAGAVNMAEAYGKLKGRPAAAMVTRGPGACHGSIGVHIAMQDSTPMLLFVGQIPHEDTGRDAFQEVDYRQMFAPLAKWVTQIDHAHRIPEVVAHAVDVATSGRPGPVVIALSEEMQKDTVTVPDLPRAPVSVAHPDPAALRKMRDMIAAAKRPIAVVGGSCWTEAGRAALGAFLVRNDIPVTVGFRRHAHYDGSQANFAGDLGVGSDPGLLGKLKEADLILALGSRLGDAVTQGYTLLDMAGAKPIVQVLPEGSEIGRVFRPALGIVSDLNVFAHALAALEPVSPAWSAWTRELRSLREAQRAVPNYEGTLNLGTVMRELETLLTPDAVVTTDAGNFAGWATRFLNFSDRQRYIGPTNGAMGYSVPAAIGASITFPGRMVVSMVGDGGFMMTGQELATAFHHQSAPIVLVFNNNQFGTIRMHQERAYPWRVSGTQVTNPDFSKYVEAFGGHGEVVGETAAFTPAFRRAVASGKPAVIELRMNPDQITTRATVADMRAGQNRTVRCSECMTATIGEAAHHYAARDLDQAARVCLEIIRDDPRHFDALHLLGVICTNRGQHADGLSYLLRAEAILPDQGRLQANIGSAYGAVQRFDKAIDAYRRAIALNHRDAGVLNNLGLGLQGLGRGDEAMETFRSAIELDPANDPAAYNLARAMAAAGRLGEAEAHLRRLRDRLAPDTVAERFGEVTNELARVVLDQGRAEESLEILRAGIAARGDIASIYWHEALLLLLLGRFREGWPAYEARWNAPNHERRHDDYRILDLAQVSGQRVLVKEEQGRGDVIQFLRYIRPLAARGARVRLSVYQDLIPLAMELPDVEILCSPDQDEAEYDVFTSLMSLPLAFVNEAEAIPAEVPYLRAPAARIGRMRQHLGPSSRRRVGLTWSGSIASRARAAMPVATLEPLLHRTDIEFHCLQKEFGADDHAWLDRIGGMTTHAEMLRDFGDTAALIDAMDLVISIDTAVAHLAGAMAKSVWVLLPFNPDWRWLLGRDDSPWYPTARLFRQPAPGDWDGVIRAVAAALAS